MVIRCITCRRLYYLDSDAHEQKCPVCGAQDVEEIATGIILEGAGNGTRLKVGAGKQNHDALNRLPASTQHARG